MASTTSVPELYRLLQDVTVPSPAFSNWAKTFHCTPLAIFEPETEQQVRLVLELSRKEGKKVRIAGVGHSPSDLACTNEFMLRTTRLDKFISADKDKKIFKAQGGITLHAVNAELAKRGLAMQSLGSISDQTLAGVVSTASHGSGIDFGCISTSVLSLTLILAKDGSKVHCTREENHELFMASLCGIGATGIVLEVELQVEDAFRLKEVQTSRPFGEVVSNLDSLLRSSQHSRFWWFPEADTVRLSFANRTTEPSNVNVASNFFWGTFMGYHVQQALTFASLYIRALNPWTQRFALWLAGGDSVTIDKSYNIFNMDCLFLQYTTEWALPLENAPACLQELHDWWAAEAAAPDGVRVHFPVEIRTSAADDIWLSPSNGKLTAWIGIVQYKPYNFPVAYRKNFKGFEAILERHAGRPHWAKSHGFVPETLRQQYPKFDDFVKVLEEADPEGLLRNEYVERHIYGKDVGHRVYKAYNPQS